MYKSGPSKDSKTKGWGYTLHLGRLSVTLFIKQDSNSSLTKNGQFNMLDNEKEPDYLVATMN